MKNDVTPLLAALKKELLDKSSLAAASRALGISPSAMTRHLSGGGISLARFLEILSQTDLSPAQFFCKIEGRSIMDKGSEEIFFELKAAQLKIERLEKVLSS